LVFVDDEWQSTCGGGLGIIFFATFGFVTVVPTQLLGLKVFSFVIVTALMSVASMSHEEYMYILAVNQRWKRT